MNEYWSLVVECLMVFVAIASLAIGFISYIAAAVCLFEEGDGKAAAGFAAIGAFCTITFILSVCYLKIYV